MFSHSHVVLQPLHYVVESLLYNDCCQPRRYDQECSQDSGLECDGNIVNEIFALSEENVRSTRLHTIIRYAVPSGSKCPKIHDSAEAVSMRF